MTEREQLEHQRRLDQDSFMIEIEKRRKDGNTSKPPYFLYSSIHKSERDSIINEAKGIKS